MYQDGIQVIQSEENDWSGQKLVKSDLAVTRSFHESQENIVNSVKILKNLVKRNFKKLENKCSTS